MKIQSVALGPRPLYLYVRHVLYDFLDIYILIDHKVRLIITHEFFQLLFSFHSEFIWILPPVHRNGYLITFVHSRSLR